MIKGPVEYVVIAFKGNKFSGDIIPAMADVVEKKVIRIIDLVFIRKNEDGDVSLIEFEDLEAKFGDDIAPIIDMVTGLVAEEDVKIFASSMEPGSAGLAIVFEHLWAAELAVAIRQSGGKMVADGHIPRQAILELLEKYGESS